MNQTKDCHLGSMGLLTMSHRTVGQDLKKTDVMMGEPGTWVTLATSTSAKAAEKWDLCLDGPIGPVHKRQTLKWPRR